MTLTLPSQTVGTARSGPSVRGSVARRRFTVRGVVQGVGFRPFVWGVANRLALSGTVCNTSGAVVIEVEGDGGGLDAFALALQGETPRLAHIDSLECSVIPPVGGDGFRIIESRAVAGEYQPVAPDAATCPECVAELFDPADRRFGYPFVNCTNCGPRFTIIEDLPYDRASTTMRSFTMCERCHAETEDPADRRFHAQPNACPACGPRLWWATASGQEFPGDPIALAAAALSEGAIVALKGLGGFQLCCDAGDAGAVQRLRARKHRPAKPFAIMCAHLDAVLGMCVVSAEERALLEGTVRPVVLLRMRRDRAASRVDPGVAPGLHELGVMLPSTPLHHLLLRAAGRALVMTSGNLSDEPIAKDNAEAVRRLGGVADAFLLHDREIHARYDDSVVRVVRGQTRMVRRARGFAPLPLRVQGASHPVLALGAHLKNTFCVLQDGNAFTGPHLGDLDDPLTLQHHAEALAAYLRLFRAAPQVVAADTHPDYASTRLAEAWWETGTRAVRVQHHHAHVASVLAEHGLRGEVLGVAFDGTGLGPDQTIWGGEFLLCDRRRFRRVGHLARVRQPGGDACARQGWRMAVAYLSAARTLEVAPPHRWAGAAGAPDERAWRLVSRLAASPTAAPISTSAGRLFDAVASVLGIAHESSFEAEAAMRLEALAAEAGRLDQVPAIAVDFGGSPLVLDTVGLVATLAAQVEGGRPAAELAAVFHESLAQAVARACHRLASELRVRRVALSGGVFQNALLLARVEELLRDLDLEVYSNLLVPANDGGISLGQALVAAAAQEDV